MDSLQSIDWIIIIGVISITLLIGFFSGRLKDSSADEYIVSSRNMGLFTFVAVNVTTWYGGILGIGEYSYRYGISSWFTQGLPYYIFALIFAFLFAGKVRATGLLSIPEKS
jgi:SSS family solute:Na+ symporter